jgi:amino acid transporter
MSGLISQRDVSYLIGYLIIVMSFSAVATLSAGRITNWRSPKATVVFGATLIPIAIIGFSVCILIFSPNAPPPNDGKAMAAAGLILVAIVTYPFTAVSSLIVGRRAIR